MIEFIDLNAEGYPLVPPRLRFPDRRVHPAGRSERGAGSKRAQAKFLTRPETSGGGKRSVSRP